MMLKLGHHLLINEKDHIDIDFFKNIDTEEKAYFIGFMISDGNVSKNHSDIKISLHKKDKHILEYFSNMIYGKDLITYDRGYPTFIVSCQIYKQDLAKYNIVPAKTLITRFPFNIDKSLYRHVIRGLIDGDGGINIYDSPVITLTGTLQLIKDIETILLEQGIKIKYYKEKCSVDNIYTLVIKKHKYVKLMIKFLYEESTVYLYRKKKKADEISLLLKNK